MEDSSIDRSIDRFDHKTRRLDVREKLFERLEDLHKTNRDLAFEAYMLTSDENDSDNFNKFIDKNTEADLKFKSSMATYLRSDTELNEIMNLEKDILQDMILYLYEDPTAKIYKKDGTITKEDYSKLLLNLIGPYNELINKLRQAKLIF